jgi:excisionase family DNA binding protein
MLTVSEAANTFRCSPDTIRRWISEGRLRAKRVTERGPLLIEADDVESAMRDARTPLRGQAAPRIEASGGA